MRQPDTREKIADGKIVFTSGNGHIINYVTRKDTGDESAYLIDGEPMNTYRENLPDVVDNGLNKIGEMFELITTGALSTDDFDPITACEIGEELTEILRKKISALDEIIKEEIGDIQIYRKSYHNEGPNWILPETLLDVVMKPVNGKAPEIETDGPDPEAEEPKPLRLGLHNTYGDIIIDLVKSGEFEKAEGALSTYINAVKRGGLMIPFPTAEKKAPQTETLEEDSEGPKGDYKYKITIQAVGGIGKDYWVQTDRETLEDQGVTDPIILRDVTVSAEDTIDRERDSIIQFIESGHSDLNVINSTIELIDEKAPESVPAEESDQGHGNQTEA
ncbi:hypothetical protein ACFL0H_08025 [Thermodesulfobacteriota bacterium]